MSDNTQVSLKRLQHFTSIWDRIHQTSLSDVLTTCESVLDGIPIIGANTDKEVESMASAFVHRVPFMDLTVISSDHSVLTPICDPTQIEDANYAAILVCGDRLWVVSDKPTSPNFRDRLNELLGDGYKAVIVTTGKNELIKVCEEARAFVTSLRDQTVVSTPKEEVEIEKLSEDGLSGKLSKSVLAKLDDIFQRIDKESATNGSELLQQLIGVANKGSATAIHINPAEDVRGGNASISLRLHSKNVEIGNIRMTNYPIISQTVRTLHGMSTFTGIPDSGMYQLRYSVDGVRTVVESRCQSTPCGVKGGVEGFCLSLKPQTLYAANQLFPDHPRLPKLETSWRFPGLSLIISPPGVHKEDLICSLLSPLHGTSSRAIVMGVTVQGHLRVPFTGIHPPRELIDAQMEMDPDHIIISSVGDSELLTVLNAAAAGKSILAGLTAHSINDAYHRLLNDTPAHIVAGVLNSISSLNSIPIQCPDCRKAGEATTEGFEQKIDPFITTGCKKCAFSGFSDSRQLLDIWILDPQAKGLIMEKGKQFDVSAYRRDLKDDIYSAQLILWLKAGDISLAQYKALIL